MRRSGSGKGFAISTGVAAGVVAMVAGGVGFAFVPRASPASNITLSDSAVQPEEAQPEAPGGGGAPDMGQQLIAGLKASPGCLGVDAAQMMSGKNTIIAWFKNKEAVEDWYFSRVHMDLMKNLVADEARTDSEPLAFIENEEIPIMVIASITFAEKPSFETIRLPISQISIELIAPLPGGAYLGGRLAPEEFKVPHMTKLDGE